MPIKKKWSAFTRDNLGEVPEAPGVYDLGNSKGEITYSGSSQDLRERLETHKRTGDKGRPTLFRFQVAGFFEDHVDAEARHAERYREQHGSLPPKQQRAPRQRGFW